MKKRIVTVVLVLSMILCSTSAVPAFAAGNESAQDLNAAVERHTLLHPEGETEEEGAYEEHAALVMFKTTKKVSEKKAKEALQTGESAIQDFQIEETYSFEKKQSAGIESKKLDYSSVCLVTSESMSTEQLVKTLRKRDDVLYAEPNYRTHIYDADVNDPYFSSQWSMQEGAYTPNVSAVWDEGTTGSDKIVVAVVDTGVNYNHEDLKECMWVNKNQPALSGKCGIW